MEVCGEVSKHGVQVHINIQPTPQSMAHKCHQELEKCDEEQVALHLQDSFPSRDGND